MHYPKTESKSYKNRELSCIMISAESNLTLRMSLKILKKEIAIRWMFHIKIYSTKMQGRMQQQPKTGLGEQKLI